MKLPRMIPIPKHLHGTILRMFEKAKWPEDRIGEVGSAMIISIERTAKEIEGRMWKILNSSLPDALREVKPNKLQFDYDILVMHEVDENGNQIGQSHHIPDHIGFEARLLAHEADSIRNSAKLVGVACMGISEEATRAMRDIYQLIHKECPSAAVGNWQLDIKEMTMVEIFDQVKDTSIDAETSENDTTEK